MPQSINNGRAPWLLEPNDCIGDSLGFLNQNTSFLNTFIQSVSSTLATSMGLLVPTGAIMPFYRSSAPAGWLACNGGTITGVGDTAALYAVLGSTTLPNLQGKFIRGYTLTPGNGSSDPDYLTRTLGSPQTDALQGHFHTANDRNWRLDARSSPNAQILAPNVFAGLYSEAHTSPTTDPITDGANGTPRIATETRPTNITLLYCIKL